MAKGALHQRDLAACLQAYRDVRHPVIRGLRVKGCSRVALAAAKGRYSSGGTEMSKAPPVLHEHGVTSPVLCKGEGFILL